MKKILIFNCIIFSVGFGCKKENLKDADLLKTQWTLSYIRDTKTNAKTIYPVDAARKISIVFIDSSNVTFSGVCNGGSGSYSSASSDGTINISVGTTLIYCKYVEWEDYVVQNMNASFSYKINGDNLEIYSDGDYNLYFTKN